MIDTELEKPSRDQIAQKI